MAVSVSPGQIILPRRQPIKKYVIQVLHSERTIALSSAALVCQEKVLRQGVGLIPGPRFVFARPPTLAMLNGVGGQMRQRRIGCFFQDGERVGIATVLVRIDEPTNQLVITIGREAIVLVELPVNSLRIEAIQAQHFVTRGRRSRNRIRACQRRHPLPKRRRRREARVKGMPIVVGLVTVPSAQVLARRRPPSHRPKRFQQAVITQLHQHRMGLSQLLLVRDAIQRDIPIAEFFEWNGRIRIRRHGRSRKGESRAG